MIGNGHQQQTGRTWKVGALAKATGLTVRTLHHYDEIGLLQPSARLAGGHRLYDADDVARLYRIIRLRQLGFPLSQVAEVLAEPEWQLAPAIERHLAEARHQAAAASRLMRAAGCDGRGTRAAGESVTTGIVLNRRGDDHDERHHPRHHRAADI